MATVDEAHESRRRQLPDDDTKPTVHSGKLVYAKPRDLPSFPSIGLTEKGSAASAAAALGWASNALPELSKSDRSAPASAAAVMTKYQKVGPTSEPKTGQRENKAALVASQSAMSTNTGRPPSVTHVPPSHSAAGAALISTRDAPPASPHTSALGRRGSLLAAKGAMANRQRAKSTPVPRESYPDEANAAANALSAATRAHRPARSLTISGASERPSTIPYTTMHRDMFTSRPPVQAEVDEQKKADVLHASAVAMAKKMYTQQQKMIDAKKSHDNAAPLHDQADVLTSVSDDTQPAHLTSLQDAAYKQAQARLARIHEEHIKARDFQEHYGARQLTRHFSIRGKFRRRSSSDGDIIEDRRRSQHIRQQMSLFSNKVSEVDERKRQQDRDALLAAAQRNVHERLKGIDEKIAAETGMMPPSTLTQWELKALAAAQARGDQRAEHRGQVDIGAGKFMDQEDIDAIAAARVQPVLDEIEKKVEEEHARQTELRLQAERKKEEDAIEKARQKEIQDINKKLKEREKSQQRKRKAEEKHEAKARREEERTAKAEQRRLAKTEKRKSAADLADGSHRQPEAMGGTIALNTGGQPISIPPPDPDATTDATGAAEARSSDRQPGLPGENSSRGGVKSWFKNRFSRGSKAWEEEEEEGSNDNPPRSFIGGAALTGMERPDSVTSSSVRAVAMAGRRQTAGRSILGEERSLSGETTSSSSDGREPHGEASSRDLPRTALTLPRPTKDPSSAAMSGSPGRDSRFHEMV
ncbi:hypothetical protein GGS23DRAFT_597124 [Durotheca rogersii]|uniref:uncharacterized protein n=1 Tax=Durotheca rogersii TaxID=419775 RepID=UPI0022203007|nr:uncharacterized protein GGS23DRAFT_597124 [Durotheca rogersii]KAI5862811.1 hypothetical protein GGS23DRAFT_597124 [Durotheca rogersii]